MSTRKPLGTRDLSEGQCTANSKRTGKRCGRSAIAGGRVCPMHGGAAPQTKAKAQERLAEMVDPALARIRKLIDSGDTDAVKLAACKTVLDRVPGLASAQTIEHQGPGGVPLLDLASVRAYMMAANPDGSLPNDSQQ